jgi:hypothetical protein
MDAVLHRQDVSLIMFKHFVLVTLIVQESPDKKHLENPGSDEVKASIGGDKQGLPYFGFLDANLKLLASSRAPGKDGKPGSNIGCPYEDDEIAAFLVMLGKAAPKMTEAERATIKEAFASLKKAAKKP